MKQRHRGLNGTKRANMEIPSNPVPSVGKCVYEPNRKANAGKKGIKVAKAKAKVQCGKQW